MVRYTITISAAAERDIRTAYCWYDAKKEELGQNFKAQLTNAIDRLEQSPLHFQIRYANIRICFLKRFPFGIHYQVSDQAVLILGVYHTHQDSSGWRLP
ncbi:MAG TPA: hypothetical protein DCE41_33445 [Cytophagales bacterium]|nr:hypothetical protein [Cytophagales bacterium]HAA19397.1 hypothetical protein [Cytophagales bacterium]HAP61270.1 hypothetical protein [Cytophagales bacterium]